MELGSGSLRITSPDLQKRIMNFVGINYANAEKNFGFLFDAYRYASPPHGGIGIGFDNLCMTMLGLTNIREVIAYPNASNGVFMHDGTPSELTDEQLRELYIKLDLR